MSLKKTVIIYDPPIEVFYEYQFLMESINGYLVENEILECKPNISDIDKECLAELGVVTSKELIDANKDTVSKIYQNKKLFRFLLEAFMYFYQQYEFKNPSFISNRAVDIILNGDEYFLEKPINLYLSPKMYVRLYKTFKRHWKHPIYKYSDLKRYISDMGDMFDIKGVGVSGHITLSTIILADYKYWLGNK